MPQRPNFPRDVRKGWGDLERMKRRENERKAEKADKKARKERERRDRGGGGGGPPGGGGGGGGGGGKSGGLCRKARGWIIFILLVLAGNLIRAWCAVQQQSRRDDLEPHLMEDAFLCVFLERGFANKVLRQFGFRETSSKKLRSDEENAKAISLFPDVVRLSDAIEDEARRLENLVRGIFAGNIFDLDSAQVVLAANDLPSINDVTYSELIDIIAKVIDLTRVPQEPAYSANDADLVILEGMVGNKVYQVGLQQILLEEET
ncbi:hypothetical protein Tsubulata_006325 [Turnera subulata]|uniref:Uncharacterized protein n=1 Tax=Turnera subulata TaxID=218843 RepID=A0A9Q0G6H8_9ROSI|nr:hypothetical protein Tsubulata_006325 [Turnera subulata]